MLKKWLDKPNPIRAGGTPRTLVGAAVLANNLPTIASLMQKRSARRTAILLIAA